MNNKKEGNDFTELFDNLVKEYYGEVLLAVEAGLN